MIKTVLFDLDGTMLPMKQDDFVKVYFGALCKKFCPVFNVTSDTMVNAIWSATKGMIKNDGTKTNYNVFWDSFSKIIGKEVLNHIKDFDRFYDEEFIVVKDVCGYNPIVAKIIKTLKDKGYRLVVATNPIFPINAVNHRLKWAGVNPEDFDFITNYDNSNYCKPNYKYYVEIAEKLNLTYDECLMVGNNVYEDVIPTNSLKMDTFLITDCLENKTNEDYSVFKNGSFEEFFDYVKLMPCVK